MFTFTRVPISGPMFDPHPEKDANPCHGMSCPAKPSRVLPARSLVVELQAQHALPEHVPQQVGARLHWHHLSRSSASRFPPTCGFLGVPAISILAWHPSFHKNHPQPWGNSWCLTRTMVEKNGESTPRGLDGGRVSHLPSTRTRGPKPPIPTTNKQKSW